MSPREFRGLLVRGEALNQIYSNPPQATAISSGGFDWGDAGIGVAAMLGATLLAAAAAVSIRRRSPGRFA